MATQGGAGAKLVSVERAMFAGSIRLVFDRDLSVTDVGRFIFKGAFQAAWRSPSIWAR
jgi:hypothetical protein